MHESNLDLDPDLLRSTIQASIQMGPIRTSDPYLYHEFSFNCDVSTVSEADKAQIIEVFGIMRDIAEGMSRRGETADNFLAED